MGSRNKMAFVDYCWSSSRSLILVVLVSPLLVAGCNESNYDIAPVSGKVTINGKPIQGLHVLFQPRAQGDKLSVGSGSTGTTDADGRFKMKMTDPQMDGAVVGNHVVRFSTIDIRDQSGRQLVLPPTYTDGSMKFEVPKGGTDQANFDISRR